MDALPSFLPEKRGPGQVMLLSFTFGRGCSICPSSPPFPICFPHGRGGRWRWWKDIIVLRSANRSLLCPDYQQNCSVWIQEWEGDSPTYLKVSVRVCHLDIIEEYNETKQQQKIKYSIVNSTIQQGDETADNPSNENSLLASISKGMTMNPSLSSSIAVAEA